MTIETFDIADLVGWFAEEAKIDRVTAKAVREFFGYKTVQIKGFTITTSEEANSAIYLKFDNKVHRLY
jgi:hypothetical protein